MKNLGYVFASELHKLKLKPIGFKKILKNYARSHEEYVEHYQIQGSSWNDATRPWVFYINCGISFLGNDAQLLSPPAHYWSARAPVFTSLALPQYEITTASLFEKVDHVAEVIEQCSRYFQRRHVWGVEQHFAQLKTILGMDTLRCQSPEMVHKEVLVHLIAYNLLRALMQKSAHRYDVSLQQISFKGSMDALRHYAQAIRAAAKTPNKQAQLVEQLLERIANDALPLRPDRVEPRAKKRRAKNYQLLTKPRSKMVIPPRRNRPKKKTTRSALKKTNIS